MSGYAFLKATSIPMMYRNGRYSFRVASRATSHIRIAVGWDGMGYIARGLHFNNGKFHVIEDNEKKTPTMSYTPSDVFHIIRVDDKIYYCRGADKPSFSSEVADICFYESPHRTSETLFLNAIVHSTSQTQYHAIFDAEYKYIIKNAEVRPNAGNNSIDISLPINLIAKNESDGIVDLRITPITYATDFDLPHSNIILDAPRVFSGGATVIPPSNNRVNVKLLAIVQSADADQLEPRANVVMKHVVEASMSEPQYGRFDVNSPLPIDLFFQCPAGAQEISFEDVVTGTGTAYIKNEPEALLSTGSGFDNIIVLDTDFDSFGRLVLRDIGTGSDSLTTHATVELESIGTGTGVVGRMLREELESIGIGLGRAEPGESLASNGSGSGQVQTRQVIELGDVVVAQDDFIFAGSVIELESTGTGFAYADTDYTSIVELFSDGTGDAFAVARNSDTPIELHSVGVVADRFSIAEPDAVAWVMNAETGAVSWWGNWMFVDAAVLPDGRILAVGPDGVTEWEGVDDAGVPIDAHVTWGLLDFGGVDRYGNLQALEKKKRITQITVGYHSALPVEASLHSFGQQYPAYSWFMPPHSMADMHRNHRIVPGKGLNSRWYRMQIAGRGPMSVHALTADVSVGKRRI